MTKLSGSEFLNSILVLTNYQVVAAIFLRLAVAVGMTELLTIEGRTAEKVAKMVAVTPRFLINIINANDRISRVKPADTGQT
jgi:hypothetical protein